jgi:uncharacterized protein YukE
MNWLGANLEELTRFSNELDRVATTLTQLNNDLGRKLHEVWWKGADADSFRSRWDTTHAHTLKQIVAALQTASNDVEQQRRAQENTSRS